MQVIKQFLGEYPLLCIVGAMVVVIGLLLCVIVYFSGYHQRQRMKKNRRQFERDLERVRRKKMKG
jgi:hypothetical protein